MLLKNFCGWCLCVFLVLGLPFLCPAQELEPRRWSHLPIKTNFAGGGYAYTEADISFDPVLRIESGKMEMHTWAAKYIRTFELFQKSARIGFTQGFQEGRWTGLVDGVPRTVKRSGLSDSILRFAINLYGAPPLEGKKFAAYRAKVDVETMRLHSRGDSPSRKVNSAFSNDILHCCLGGIKLTIKTESCYKCII